MASLVADSEELEAQRLKDADARTQARPAQTPRISVLVCVARTL